MSKILLLFMYVLGAIGVYLVVKCGGVL